jgi:hypothetical protein
MKERSVPEVPPPPLSPRQATCLESLLKAGFQFVTFEQFARYPAVEKAGFVALLDLSGEKVRQFGSIGYHVGNGIGVLVDRPGGKAFVWKNSSAEASPELLATYAQVKKELEELLAESHYIAQP